MEDENLELSLGLACGVSCHKSEVKDGPSDSKAVEGIGRKSPVGDLNVSDVSSMPLFSTSIGNLDCNVQHMSTPLIQKHENFWTDLGQRFAPKSDGPRYQELWVSSNTLEDYSEKSGMNKRKLPFGEINFEKKNERRVDHVDMRGKSPNAVNLNNHVSITTEDSSFGENEDATESEVKGSTSWLVSRLEENVDCSVTLKVNDIHFSTELSAIGSQDKNQSNVTRNNSNLESGKLAYGTPFLLQPTTVMAGPKQVHVKAPVDSFMLGYQTQHAPAYGRRSCGDGRTNHEQCEDEPNVSHDIQVPRRNPSPYRGKASELSIGSGKHVEEAGMLSSDETKGNNTTFGPKEIPDNHPVAEGSSHEGITIRPCVPLDLKFGGCGSSPDLPWVSTTSPDGKTISGVTYKYSQNEVKIVCACHGTHMSPEEFVQHARKDA